MGIRLANGQEIFITEEPLTSTNVKEIKRQWHNRYAMKKIPKSSEFDSWWIQFKKFGIWIIIFLMFFYSINYLFEYLTN